MERLLTREQVAEILGVQPQTIVWWTAKGEIPYIKLGHNTRYDRKDIERWINSKKVQKKYHDIRHC